MVRRLIMDTNFNENVYVGDFKEFSTRGWVSDCSSDDICSGNDCDGSDGGCGSCDND
jgi:hypothetical protein